MGGGKGQTWGKGKGHEWEEVRVKNGKKKKGMTGK